MKVLVWGIEPTSEVVEHKARYLLDTAKYFNIDVEILGVGCKFTTFTNRLYILQDYLKDIDPNEIVIVLDGYDTLFNNTVSYAEEQFKLKDTRILISAEKIYTYQWLNFQDKFDTIESEYRYVNAGTYMGYAGDLRIMLSELFEIYKNQPTDIDQGLLGVWVYTNFQNKKKVQLDSNCEVFWVTSKDWNIVKNLDGKEVINPFTKTKPFIIHNPGNGDPTLYESYEKVYNKIKLNYE